MATYINGDTGVSKVQDGAIVAADLAGGAGTGNLTQYTAAVTPLPGAGVTMSAAHSLGGVPYEAVLELTCLVAGQGYVVGEGAVPAGMFNGSTIYPVASYKTSTHVGQAYLGGYAAYIVDKSTGGALLPTAANWSYRFRLRAA